MGPRRVNMHTQEVLPGLGDEQKTLDEYDTPPTLIQEEQLKQSTDVRAYIGQRALFGVQPREQETVQDLLFAEM